MERVIMHVDMDAFFASIEIVDNPNLKGKPVIVGGTSERGVVATCSYEARKYGVRSAMPIYMAKSKCPHGIFLPTRMSRYKEVSKEIFKIFYTLTPYVEPVSIDEAYLDITHSKIQPLKAAKYIKEEVKRTTRLTLSVGISFNKFLAKIASDWNKPNGLKIITKDMIPKILFPLPIDKVYGLGKKSVKKLNNIGVFTVEELYNLPLDILVQFFGKYGIEIYERIRGIDKRKVEISRQRKSIGKETTLKRDTDDKDELKEYIKNFCSSISKDLSSKNVSGKTITLKIKTSSFKNHTKSRTLSSYISRDEDIYKEACEILDSIELSEQIRLIGVSISSLKENKIKQMTLFDY
ncbi:MULTISPECIES: DNA polymerase IV [Clostridium]|uniref:DNA polymerase IV n=2 Tax=Clostridium TaxID=1485 RepID=A0A151ALB7_9CLOT|nr:MULTISPECIES: DNA polymerase IV [Clostridium]KYH28320.1 DNA polymerase IV [Clostridium colicanis DSM 13634]MBE6043622.1 DNA polymerase IV [Clostridium thermopalmarium]PRR68762.1 DNA polymerase IV [Clostridium thermopalmarium DSM 5974]PVZ22655.1 DNA polymerase-4 [Clostridium thermopalmarium DSM 5974]